MGPEVFVSSSWASAPNWTFDEFEGNLGSISIYLDASPWGLGGVLFIDGVVYSWFQSRLTHWDEKIHQRSIGDCKGQQVWECLAVLVALKYGKISGRRGYVISPSRATT